MHTINLKKRNAILTVISVLLVLTIIIVFWYITHFVRTQTTDTINNVGNMYMNGLNERITSHFRTTMDYRFEQLEEAIELMPASAANSVEQLRGYMEAAAARHDWSQLALCGSDGWLDAVFGGEITMYDKDLFVQALNNGEKWVATGFDENERMILLIGVPAHYPMFDGTLSSGVVVGMSLDYIQQILDASDELASSHIIRHDGSYTLRSDDSKAATFFDRLLELSAEEELEPIKAANQGFLQAMEHNENYSVILTLNGERNHWFCTKLPYSDWYLSTRMPFGVLDEAVNQLSHSIVRVALIGCTLLLLGMLLLFVLYYDSNKAQKQELTQARHEAESANKAKSEFLSSMSHDIRTPMNAIVGMTAIAIANIDNKLQLQNCLNKISLSSKHLLGLINDVLDMSKIESGKLTMNIDNVSLREAMDSIVSIVQPQIRAKRQNFNVSINDINTENVRCDGVRLNQVLINLLSNAVKFTPEGGTITLSLREEASPKGENFVRVFLEVQDTGYGMSPEFAERIFDSFSREDTDRVNKTEGTGLGMAITKYIIDTMGGTITLHSEKNVGTTFYVTLDLEKAAVQGGDMTLPNNWRMLLVDDDPMLCRSAVKSLRDIGVQAESVLDGESAIRLVKKCHEQHNDFQIILLDWKLPGLNGIETAREIRSCLDDDIPILLISAYDWTDIEADAREAGINGFISKPLFKSTLYYGLRPFANMENVERPSAQPPLRDFTGKKILLAEDNDLNWEIAEALLSEEGLELDWAENGQACLEIFQHSEVGHYDAILMDIRMPVLTGYEAAKQIRALERPDAKEIPIIAMTADAFAEDIQRCLDCGMNAHIAKPIDVHEVLTQLDKFMKP